VVQGVTSNYDTDLLRTLVEKAAEIAGKKYSGSHADDDVSMRVIADHARTTARLDERDLASGEGLLQLGGQTGRLGTIVSLRAVLDRDFHERLGGGDGGPGSLASRAPVSIPTRRRDQDGSGSCGTPARSGSAKLL
jgi:hypothetical protein